MDRGLAQLGLGSAEQLLRAGIEQLDPLAGVDDDDGVGYRIERGRNKVLLGTQPFLYLSRALDSLEAAVRLTLRRSGFNNLPMAGSSWARPTSSGRPMNPASETETDLERTSSGNARAVEPQPRGAD